MKCSICNKDEVFIHDYYYIYKMDCDNGFEILGGKFTPLNCKLPYRHIKDIIPKENILKHFLNICNKCVTTEKNKYPKKILNETNIIRKKI